jgi:methyl-accepting chemotaxis protein
VKQMLVCIGDLEPGDETIVQKGLDTAERYQQQFASVVSTMTESRQEPEERLREAVLAYEKDLDALVKAARHEKRAQLIQELRTIAGSFDTRITEAIQVANPASRTVAPDLQASSGQILQVASELEKRNWGRVEADHENVRHLIRRAEWSLGIVSIITLVFSVWVSLVLPGQVVKPLVNLKEAVDQAATGNYEIDFELHGGGEVVELARSVQNLISGLRERP